MSRPGSPRVLPSGGFRRWRALVFALALGSPVRSLAQESGEPAEATPEESGEGSPAAGEAPFEVQAGPGAPPPFEVQAGPGAPRRPPAESSSGQPGFEVQAGPGAEAPEGRTAGAPASPEGTGPGIEPADQVLVMGTRSRQVAGSAHIVREEQLERNEYDDPHRVLRQVPGVYVRGEDGFGLRPNIGIRGASSDRSKKVTLMEDGILFGPAPYSAPAAYYFPLITRMRSVRVIKGPSAIVYGPQTIGGAIDFMTRDVPADSGGALDVAYGQFHYGKIHGYYGLSNDRSGILVEGVHTRSDGFKHIDGGGDTGYRRNEWMVKGYHAFDPTADVYNELELKLGFSDEVSNETYLGLTDEDFRDDPFRRYAASRRDRMEWHRTQIALKHTVEFDLKTKLTTTLYRNDFDRNWVRVKRFEDENQGIAGILRNPTITRRVFYDVLRGAQASSSSNQQLLIGPNDRQFVSQGLQTVGTWRGQSGPIGHKLEYGVRYHNDRVVRLHSEDSFDMTAEGRLERDTTTPRNVSSDNMAETHAVAMHVTDAMTWGPFTLTPGLRTELIRWKFRDDLTGVVNGDAYAVFLPGAGAFYELPQDVGLLAGVYRGFSPEAPGPPADTEPEDSINYEAGVRWTPERAQVEAIGFFNDYNNLTSICTFATGCVVENVNQQFDAGEVNTYGLEAHAANEFRSSFGVTFPAIASYTFTRSRFLNVDPDNPALGDIETGDELPYIPRHQLSFTLGAESEVWGLSATGTYVDEMLEKAGRRDDESIQKTDAFFLLDAGGHFYPLPELKLYLNVRNALGAEYIASRRPLGARPGAPRWVQAGAKYTF